MKETPIFEEIVMRMIRQPGFWRKLLIGGLLSFVPIINIFAFGYLFRFSRRVRRTGQMVLPEWEDWKGLFMDGLKFAVAWLGYWLLPVLLACGLAGGLVFVGMGGLSYVICSFVLVAASVLFCSALYRLQMRANFKDLLDVPLIFRMTWGELPRFILPGLVFLGIFTLLRPLYGFAFFLGFLILIGFSHSCFHRIEQRQAASL